MSLYEPKNLANDDPVLSELKQSFNAFLSGFEAFWNFYIILNFTNAKGVTFDTFEAITGFVKEH